MNENTADPEQVDQLAHEFLQRYRRGERPSLTDYAEQHPELAGEIRELFPAMVVMERLGPRQDELGSKAAGVAGAIPEQLGEYRILREVGRGGMGVVYEAEQGSLGRRVALKVLPFHALMSATHLERFRREARAAARLHHTNIVPVYGVGEQDGIHYYAMQFIQGQGLDEILSDVYEGSRTAPVSIRWRKASRMLVPGLDQRLRVLWRARSGRLQCHPRGTSVQPSLSLNSLTTLRPRLPAKRVDHLLPEWRDRN